MDKEKKRHRRSKEYPKWVGVLMSFLLAGSAQFISGQRVAGILWYASLFIWGLFSMLILAVPINAAIYIFAVFTFMWLVLWIIMLRQSYRHVRRIGFLGWVAIILILIMLDKIENRIIKSAVEVFDTPASSMAPTIMGKRKYGPDGKVIPQTGDRVFVEKISYYFYPPRRGELAARFPHLFFVNFHIF